MDKGQVKRQITLETTINDQQRYRLSNFSKNTDSFSTLNKFTDKKVNSRKKTVGL